MSPDEIKKFRGSEIFTVLEAARKFEIEVVKSQLTRPCSTQEAFIEQERLKGKLNGLNVDLVERAVRLAQERTNGQTNE